MIFKLSSFSTLALAFALSALLVDAVTGLQITGRDVPKLGVPQIDNHTNVAFLYFDDIGSELIVDKKCGLTSNSSINVVGVGEKDFTNCGDLVTITPAGPGASHTVFGSVGFLCTPCDNGSILVNSSVFVPTGSDKSTNLPSSGTWAYWRTGGQM